MKKKIFLFIMAAVFTLSGVLSACSFVQNSSSTDDQTQTEESVDTGSQDDGLSDNSSQTPCAHTGGEATCTKKAICDVCGEPYGEFADHAYTEVAYKGLSHWYECVCGKKDITTQESHKGGEATCTQKAICSVCKQEYGDFAHEYNQLNYDGETHWYECSCGEKDSSTQEGHKGGEATCTKKAVCGVCKQEYGKFADHEYTEIKYGATTYWYECVCGDKGEEQNRKSIEECVDFVVDVQSGRDIRVLQLTDVQTIDPTQKRYESRISGSSPTDTTHHYKRYIGQIIESYQPDLIIMTGDNTYGEFDDNGEQLLGLIEFMDSFEIPWAPVFGNHDNESNMGVDWQCDQFENSKYCLFKQRELTGNGNYTVGVTQDGELKRVFYMLDSNGCGAMSAISLSNGHGKTTAGFGQDQIDWYSQSMEEISVHHPDANFSMAFHIQIYAYEKAMKQYGFNASTIRSNPINLDTLDAAKAAGDFGFIGREPKGAWDYDLKVWNTILKYGVDSVFVGHEHCNSASIEYEGVRLTYGQKSSTYDRYNLTKADGTITNSSITYSGTPIMGGTFIQLSQYDGTIVDAGLYLYDHELGWEESEQEDKITIDTIPEGATVTEFDFNGSDFDTAVLTPAIQTMSMKKLTDTSSVPTGFTQGVYGYESDNLTCVGIQFNDIINADSLMAIFVKMHVSEYTVTEGKEALLRIYNTTENSIVSEMSFTKLGGKMGEWVYIDVLPLLEAASGEFMNGQLSPFTLLYRFYGANKGSIYFDSITVVSDGDMFQESEPENLTSTEFDFNGRDFNATVTTDTIKSGTMKKVTDTTGVPEGFTGDVYSYASYDLTCVGIKFSQQINADKLRSVIVRMYVSEYTLKSGKTPLLRIYNATANSILSEMAYDSLGGKFGQWVSIDILPLIKGASGIIEDGKLSPFTLLYRFYGEDAGTVYFDSLTVVANGDMYAFEQIPEDGRPTGTVRDGVLYYQYSANEFNGATGTLGGGTTAFMAIDESAYSIKFSLTATAFAGELWVYGYTSESNPQGGIGVKLTKSSVTIKKGSGTVSISTGAAKQIEVGFVGLYNGNTVYVFVKVDGKLVAWELCESFGKTAGNIAIVSKNANDSFTLA